MEQENKKEYTGVWIPADVMESEELEPLDKLVYAEIAGFNNCYASNAWIAGRVKKSEMSARRSVAKLIKLGFVEIVSFDGRKRTIRVLKYGQSACSNMNSLHVQIRTPNNKVENKNNISNKLDIVQEAQKDEQKEYGNQQVNELMTAWKIETGIEANGTRANRLAAYNIIRSRGMDGAKEIVRLCGRAMRSKDQYAPVISSFRDLQGRYEKLSKLMAWAHRQEVMAPKQAPQYRNTSEPEILEISDEERQKTLEYVRELRRKANI